VLAARDRADLLGTGEPAAVLLVLFDHAGESHLVLQKRTEYPGHHSGEISLPGGRHEATDADLRITALRETHEEVGIDPASLVVLGPLDDVATRVSGFTVQPWVAHHPGGRPAMTPDPGEVAALLEVPLADLLAADHLLPPDPPFGVLRYPLLGEDVWGLTARILRTFLEIMRDATAPDA
jgi:8-oxo-dGTP pyrophosphatase MutT (NUDIX family)